MNVDYADKMQKLTPIVKWMSFSARCFNSPTLITELISYKLKISELLILKQSKISDCQFSKGYSKRINRFIRINLDLEHRAIFFKIGI